MSAWQELLSAWALVWTPQGVQSLPQNMPSAWVLAMLLALITLLLEDAAIAAGAALAATGLMSWSWAFAGVAGGIAVGDMALYGLGAGVHRIAGLQQRWLRLSARHLATVQRLQTHLQQQLPSAILLARVIPGLRLLTYTTCGWLRVDLVRFSLWCCLAVALWTAGLFCLSTTVGELITHATGLTPALATALPVLVLALAVPAFRYVHAEFFMHKERRP